MPYQLGILFSISIVSSCDVLFHVAIVLQIIIEALDVLERTLGSEVYGGGKKGIKLVWGSFS